MNSLTIRHNKNRRSLEPTGGIRFLRKIGDSVSVGEPLAVCFGRNEDEVKGAAAEFKSLISITEERTEPPPLFH